MKERGWIRRYGPERTTGGRESCHATRTGGQTEGKAETGVLLQIWGLELENKR